jgi:hypothetical protein
METIGRGVLDRPVEPGDDAYCGARTLCRVMAGKKRAARLRAKATRAFTSFFFLRPPRRRWPGQARP